MNYVIKSRIKLKKWLSWIIFARFIYNISTFYNERIDFVPVLVKNLLFFGKVLGQELWTFKVFDLSDYYRIRNIYICTYIKTISLWTSIYIDVISNYTLHPGLYDKLTKFSRNLLPSQKCSLFEMGKTIISKAAVTRSFTKYFLRITEQT